MLELDVILQTELAEVDVLCLSEHWLREEYIKLITIDEFKLTSSFSRSKSIHGGTCMKAKERIPNAITCDTQLNVPRPKLALQTPSPTKKHSGSS